MIEVIEYEKRAIEFKEKNKSNEHTLTAYFPTNSRPHEQINATQTNEKLGEKTQYDDTHLLKIGTCHFAYHT
jgi:hypothetical protein